MKSCNEDYGGAGIPGSVEICSQIIRAEIPDVARIVRDECWLEGERRGAPVSPHDIVVQRRVAEIILAAAGAQLRTRYETIAFGGAAPQGI